MTSAENKRLVFVNFVMGRIHEHVSSIYEDLADDNFVGAADNIKWLTVELEDLTEQITDGRLQTSD
tara:strand:- start:65 stop:262 length:198 start_codon:yes stop_codon:yes gene_type:complete